jgi:hypothetical protein
MKVWPIDPLVPRNLRLEVPEKLPQGLAEVRTYYTQLNVRGQLVNHSPRLCPHQSLVRPSLYCADEWLRCYKHL